ncbi:hypothetical protein C8R46DRAFT_1212275 [Mycena filopes]|nr:hypothetical protein C8R46DRAFT_1212275 [Mycena filopes]
MFVKLSRKDMLAEHKLLDQYNGSESSSRRKQPNPHPVLRQALREMIVEELSTKEKMTRVSRTERLRLAHAAEQLEVRRAKARERMAIRRAKIKALPSDEQAEYHEKARESRAKYREQNRRYLAVASWGYRNRKYVEFEVLCSEESRYKQYIVKSSRRADEKEQRARQQEARTRAAAEVSDLPDSSEVPSTDSE